jgi:hypothetical protein
MTVYNEELHDGFGQPSSNPIQSLTMSCESLKHDFSADSKCLHGIGRI